MMTLQDQQKTQIPLQPQNTKSSPIASLYQTQLSNYNIFQLILITFRLLFSGIIICYVLLFQDYIRPRIMIPSIRRYLSCIVNLISIRIVLILFGFLKFQCENYRYFDKSSRSMSFRSGWVGVASRKNIIDFLYYSYLFNPTYVRVIEYHPNASSDPNNNPNSNTTTNPNPNNTSNKQQQIKLFYMPLTFKQAFFASLTYRGFDPIVINGQQQMKKFKRRKMLMPTLISQCFQQMNGPILIFLPCINPKQQLKTNQILGHDIFDNQKKFLRSGITFISQIQQSLSIKNISNRKIPQFCNKIYINQLLLLIQICSQIKQNILTITATQIIKYKYQYTRQSYSQFIDQIYNKIGYKIINIGYQEYIKEMDGIYLLKHQESVKQQDNNNNGNNNNSSMKEQEIQEQNKQKQQQQQHQIQMQQKQQDYIKSKDN